MSTLRGSQGLRSTSIILIGFSLSMKQFWRHRSYPLRQKVVCHADRKVFLSYLNIIVVLFCLFSWFYKIKTTIIYFLGFTK
jgi:hypothetical protein